MSIGVRKFMKVINNAKKYWQENAGKKPYSYPMTLFNKLMICLPLSSHFFNLLSFYSNFPSYHPMCSNWLSRLTPTTRPLPSSNESSFLLFNYHQQHVPTGQYASLLFCFFFFFSWINPYASLLSYNYRWLGLRLIVWFLFVF